VLLGIGSLAGFIETASSLRHKNKYRRNLHEFAECHLTFNTVLWKTEFLFFLPKKQSEIAATLFVTRVEGCAAHILYLKAKMAAAKFQ